MKYERILGFLAAKPWAMEQSALHAMTEYVCARAAGTELEPTLETFEADRMGGTPWFADIGAAVGPQTAGAVARRAGRVAVLPVRGTILHRLSGMQAMSGGTGLETLARTFVGLRDDPQVKAIILDIDSPGGSVDGLPEMADLIRGSRGAKPIVSQVNVRAASAAYWLAVQADEVAVTPSGDVGSIGVITVHEDVSAMLEALGVKETVIASTPYKAEGHPYGPLSEEAHAAITTDVMAFDAMFHDAVAAGRGVKEGTVRSEFGQGRMVLAKDAVSRGMADRVATMEQTLNRFGATMLGGSTRAAAHSSRIAARSFLRRDSLRAQ